MGGKIVHEVGLVFRADFLVSKCKQKFLLGIQVWLLFAFTFHDVEHQRAPVLNFGSVYSAGKRVSSVN